MPLRTCPHCGEQARSRDERCPACGRSYFEKPDRFSVRTRRILQAVAALGAALVLALIVVVLSHQAHDNGVSARARRAAAAATERARLTREQRAHHALAAGRRPARCAARPPACACAARWWPAWSARSRPTRAGASRATSSKARSIVATHCHALGNGARGDELDLRKALGRYACEAAS